MNNKLAKKIFGGLLLGGICATSALVPSLMVNQNTLVASKQATDTTTSTTTDTTTSTTDKNPSTSESNKPNEDTSNITINNPNDRWVQEYIIIIVALGATSIVVVIVAGIVIEIWYKKKKTKDEYLPVFD